MREKKCFFLYVLSLGLTACNAQNNKDSASLVIRENSTFEEKQRKDLLVKNPDPVISYSSVLNFRLAAQKVTPCVVHIRSTYSFESRYDYLGEINDDFWYKFFSDVNLKKPQSDASGVIVSSDGYIVTNDHVIEHAEEIEVILDNQKSYMAKVVGIDPETDLALLKIDETNLSFVELGNSDEVEVGDWVLAVGNPFNLTSTVTAGIVSAKARNIDILKRRNSVESFIQTDAAINPGNSGSALVDVNGKLIGINSAIATPTGAYAGYSFATPVNIVKKIINDLLKSGKVQRAYLGAVLKNMSASQAKLLNADIANGVYIDSVFEGSAAMEANVKLKDIITAIDEHTIKTTAEFQEIMERHRPGELVTLTIIRNGVQKRIPVTLKEAEGDLPEITVKKEEVFTKLGIKITELTEREKKRLKITSGVKVAEVSKGIVYRYTNIKKGFVITEVNGKPINTEADFVKAAETTENIIMLEGVYPHFGGVFYYAFSIK
jgi:serine protease Do